MKRSQALIVMLFFLLGHSVYAGTFALWQIGEMGDWHGTNWLDENGSALPTPGYPTNNFSVEIEGGLVTISSQNVDIAYLQISQGSILTVTNGRTITVRNSTDFQPTDQTAGYLQVPYGSANIFNTKTSTVYGLSFDLGTNNTSGYLDFGAEWGATNGFAANFGTLYACAINLQNGGFRVDASNITMQTTCTVCNAGQEMTFRGDWLNPDGSTVFAVNGYGTGTIDIAGNFSFGGCKLYSIIATNGVNLIQVGGDATLTNSTLTVGVTTNLTNSAASYDLVRVPAANTISTNGMVCCVSSNSGFTYTTSLDLNRGGYDYLVITPDQFLPSVTITNPADESFFTAVTNITINATASARSGSITKVEFYADTNKVGEVTNVPYTVTWTNVYAGYYELKAIATDNNSNQGTSPSIGLNVQGTRADGRKVFITGGAVITYDPGCAQ